MSPPDLCSESDILIRFNIDKAVDCVVRWLQDSSITQYFEDHPDARDTIVAAVQKLPRPETLSTPASTPCYTNLSSQQAPLPLTSPHDTQRLELINNRDTDNPEAKSTSRNSQYSTDLDVSPPFDRNNEIHNQDTSEGGQPSRRNATLLQADTQSPCLGSRRSKRPRIEDEDETDVKLESPNFQQRQVAKLSHRLPKKNKLPKVVDHLHNKEGDRFTELDLDLRLKVQKMADIETLNWAQEYLSLMRNPALYVSNMTNEDVFRQIGSLSTTETKEQIIGKLRSCIEREDEKKKSRKVLSRESQVSERLYLAELIGMFIKERDVWKTSPKKRRKPNEIRLSPKDRFVNVVFPETMTYKGEHISEEKKKKRKEAKNKFECWLRYGKPWADMVQRFGYGIFLVSFKLSNEDFRRLPRPHIELFLDYIDFIRPGLKDQLSNLSILLPGIVYYGILPPQMLVLEKLPLSEVGDRPLEDLLQYYSEDQSTMEPAQELLQYYIEDQDAVEPAQGTIPECPPEDPNQLSSPLRMDSGTPSDPVTDISEYVCFSSPDVLWAGDCEFRLNTGAIEAKNSMINNFREESYPCHASHLDNEFLLSPMINVDFEELLRTQ